MSAEREGDLEKARRLAGEYVALQKRFFDWMLRAKINLAWNSTNIRPGDAPETTTVVRAALKEIHEYGLERGIESMASDTTAIGTSPRDKDNPDFKDVVFHRSHKRYFCWSRLEYHERRAKRAQFVPPEARDDDRHRAGGGRLAVQLIDRESRGCSYSDDRLRDRRASYHSDQRSR